MKINDNENLAFFICSQEVIDAFPDSEHSKPFKSGFENDDDDNYVALLDFEKVEKYYNQLPEDKQDNFWCKECVAGTMDVSKISISGARKNGLFVEIENKTRLTTERNRAMIVYNLSQKYKCTPIELINKISINKTKN